jgi:polyether ionophore transport system permease protein
MATVAATGSPTAVGLPSGAFATLLRRALRDSRTRVLGFVYVFAAVSFIQPVAYRHTYPTLEERVRFAASFAHNKAVVLFYGKAYDLLTVGGYSAWRVGGTLTIFAAVFGVLAAVRALRAEEDAGRAELVLATAVGRGTLYTASMSAVALGGAALWLAAFAGLLVGGLPAGGSAYLALAVVSVIPVFAGVGALVSQAAPSRRTAIELGGALVALFFLLRVIADTSSAGWLRWATPLGWAEELRPFTGARPLVLLLSLLSTVALILAAARIEMSRDVGTGLLAPHDSAGPRPWLLSSPTAQALRAELGSLAVWVAGVGAIAFVLGVVSESVSSLGISKPLEHTLERLGQGSVLTPIGYLGFSFSFFVLVVALLAVSQVAAARHEESDERLETVLALPVARWSWLGGRLWLAAGACALVALAAGVLAWLGATVEGVGVSLPRMLEAGLNCLPVALLILGLAALAYAAVPRASVAIAYGLVVVAYLWQLFGSLLGAPRWLVDATPFAHVGAVPAQPFRVVAAVVMVAIGVVAGAIALAVFRRRDLLSA